MNPFYEAEAHLKSQGQDLASLHSQDGRIHLTVANPLKSELIENATNPEQLFAAAFLACFQNALSLKAKQLRISLNQFEITGKVAIDSEKNRAFHLSVLLQVGLPELNRDQALHLIEEARKAWPFAKADDGGLHIQIELVDRIAPVI